MVFATSYGRPTAQLAAWSALLKHVTTRQMERTGGGWGCSDTGREGVPTREEACAAMDFELEETMRCEEIVSRGFGDCATYVFSKANYPICPAHPPHLPLPLIVVFVAWHRNGAAHWDRPPPHHHHHSQCWAGPAAWREGTGGVLSHACKGEKQAPGERTNK